MYDDRARFHCHATRLDAAGGPTFSRLDPAAWPDAAWPDAAQLEAARPDTSGLDPTSRRCATSSAAAGRRSGWPVRIARASATTAPAAEQHQPGAGGRLRRPRRILRRRPGPVPSAVRDLGVLWRRRNHRLPGRLGGHSRAWCPVGAARWSRSVDASASRPIRYRDRGRGHRGLDRAVQLVATLAVLPAFDRRDPARGGARTEPKPAHRIKRSGDPPATRPAEQLADGLSVCQPPSWSRRDRADPSVSTTAGDRRADRIQCLDVGVPQRSRAAPHREPADAPSGVERADPGVARPRHRGRGSRDRHSDLLVGYRRHRDRRADRRGGNPPPGLGLLGDSGPGVPADLRAGRDVGQPPRRIR